MAQWSIGKSRLSTILSLLIVVAFTAVGFAVPFYQSISKPDTVALRTEIVLFPKVAPSVNIANLATVVVSAMQMENPKASIVSEGNAIVFYDDHLPRDQIDAERQRRSKMISAIEKFVSQRTEEYIQTTKTDAYKFPDNAALYDDMKMDRGFERARSDNAAPYISEIHERIITNRKSALGADLGAVLGFMFGVATLMAISEFRRYPWRLV